ncbi:MULTISPECIES: VOC family protein [Bradyrhizobium]|uniref:VOC family protein n=1 Tax=Bradyrhizobium TaxID=374 RepID=UPI000489832F|nr:MULTISPECIES: VOC family protein [Bradyrhizobium]MCS3448479.1 catechol 2,3-dioxygenase-like lactoylglutathione lyase family enzyme [Bradyrhizobium elkanii]MCS3560382.1 catechol 2,3-dioxygenase-like lactoylglutathione lyase family enzyme [Bradyrhizobium elkanii]MCW2149775.1 catechol 2,3-dioxygenase-like lactoylglutathione lyase family enzyme [Bradyrhizobium elkanii]MCW2360258.1 catechol 2,3-dioxygenase-like lactoylglutathione lyase family enzyme [Bradyrhizobium elkanii]MCW2373504.1 catechol 
MTNQTPETTIGVDHVGLTVREFETTRRFFCDCLGWKVVGGNPSYPAVFVSDGHARVTLWQVQQPDTCVSFDRKRNLGLHHLALKVGSLTGLQSLYERVAACPAVIVEFAPELLGNGPKTHFMIQEPGGVRLEFACDPANR